MTPKQLHILRHSLGLDDNGHGNIYRDYYCTVAGGCEDIKALVASGLIRAGHKINDGRDQYFHVTEDGKAAALRDVAYPKVSKARRRYHAFLRLDTGITFKEFLTSPCYKRCREDA